MPGSFEWRLCGQRRGCCRNKALNYVSDPSRGLHQHLNVIQAGLKVANTVPDSTQLPLQHVESSQLYFQEWVVLQLDYVPSTGSNSLELNVFFTLFSRPPQAPPAPPGSVKQNALFVLLKHTQLH